jgi:hypothetical protein
MPLSPAKFAGSPTLLSPVAPLDPAKFTGSPMFLRQATGSPALAGPPGYVCGG